ncbi:AAA family ATPase [Candidatus Parabeggiatoa sp. HSG14]|uniref:ParA family protein n=1 Tax=Candidatus Parabeggiatoa sp. HSG14 TaxID=3055593 RepID=UPI0025A73B28|nr:AAA family ATPase [Thiotrichales bacterium HSG14]
MTAKVISFINLKGGVGKTTCCVNIAGEFAHSHKKVLVIDADAQSNTSILLMNPERYINDVLLQNQNPKASEDEIIAKTVYQIFLDAIEKKDKFDFDNAIITSVVNYKEKQSLPNLDLLPASFHLQELEQKIVTYKRTQYIILNNALKKIKEQYDLILIDCPPNLYTATMNALYASDYYVIPALPEKLSLFGIELLIKQLNEVIEIAEEESDKSVKLAGIILNNVIKAGNSRSGFINAHGTGIEDIEQKIFDFKEKGSIDKNAKVFDTMIHQRTSLREAASEFVPMCIHKPRDDSTSQFKKVCAEILKQIND